LAGLLLPSLATARNMVRRIECGNNLKTLGQSTFMYGSDYGFYYPHSIYNRGTISCSWSSQLAPYCTKYISWTDSVAHLYSATVNPDLKPIASFICQAQRIKSWRDYSVGLSVYQGNYTANGDIYKIYVEDTTFLETNKNFNSIKVPSNNGLLWDGINPNYVSALANNNVDNIDITSSLCTAGYPHKGKTTNVLYADGHVLNCRMNPLLPIAHIGNELTN
jgi:prepilin-type processing-associated H-X9-DG protein